MLPILRVPSVSSPLAGVINLTFSFLSSPALHFWASPAVHWDGSPLIFTPLSLSLFHSSLTLTPSLLSHSHPSLLSHSHSFCPAPLFSSPLFSPRSCSPLFWSLA